MTGRISQLAQQTEVILTFTDHSRRERRIVTTARSVSLGRDSGNDVAIDDSNLSRHHAVIENTGKAIYVFDCNSRNGTSLNGHAVVGRVELFHGDVINLAGSCDIVVSFQQASSSSTRAPISLPAIAVAAVALVLLTAGLLLVFYSRTDTGKSAKRDVIDERDKDQQVVSSPSPVIAKTSDDVAAETPEHATEQMSRTVKRVMSKLSNDGAPYISEAGVNDVKRRVEEYRGSNDLKEKLHAVKQGCPEITAQAQRISLRPALVMYAALADSEVQKAGDPITAARRMTPRLLTLRATFGTETANSSLLLIAAYPYPFNPVIGSQTRTPHPLASKLVEFGGRRSTVDTSEARSVWFLREKNGITDEAYDLVIRLLAIGVIAENPTKYGIEAPPPLC